MALERGLLNVSSLKAAALSDASPKEIRAQAAPLIDPVFYIELTGDVAALAATTVTSDTTASGGGVDVLLEGAAWNAGATLAASATNLAAALQAALQVHDATWTAVANGAVITATLTGEFATGEGCTITSDANASYLLQGVVDSLVENWTLWQAGDGYGVDNENVVNMDQNDILYFMFFIQLSAASNTTEIRFRLSFYHEAVPGVQQRFFYELGLDQQVVAGGVLPFDARPVEYRIPVTAGRTIRRTMSLPIDLQNVKVEVKAEGLPDADDLVGVEVVRWMRHGATSP